MKKLLLKKLLSVSIITVSAVSLIACGATKLKDGNYTGRYENEKKTDTMDVVVTIKDNKIVNVSYDAKRDGKPKDENYGKNLSPEDYKKAQLSVEGMKKYPKELIETQDPDKIDAVGGATVSKKAFVSAVKDALKKAK